MKKKLLWPLVLISIVLALLISYYLTNSTTDVNVFKDAQIGVSFEYPLHWETRESEDRTLFASNFDYLDGLAESSTSTEKEGTFIYSVSEGAPTSIEELQDRNDADYESCLADFEKSGLEFGPPCIDTDYSEWTESMVGGYTALSSEWHGAPASGEIVKQIVILIEDKALIATLTAVKTGVTDEQVIEATWQQAVDSLRIK